MLAEVKVCLEEGMAWVKGESLESSGARGRPAGMEAEVRGEAQWAVRTLEWVLGGELKPMHVLGSLSLLCHPTPAE